MSSSLYEVLRTVTTTLIDEAKLKQPKPLDPIVNFLNHSSLLINGLQSRIGERTFATTMLCGYRPLLSTVPPPVGQVRRGCICGLLEYIALAYSILLSLFQVTTEVKRFLIPTKARSGSLMFMQNFCKWVQTFRQFLLDSLLWLQWKRNTTSRSESCCTIVTPQKMFGRPEWSINHVNEATRFQSRNQS